MEQRLIAYLHSFNIARDYYECHEVGESLWLDSGRPIILKGLIQAAVCLYHLDNGNIRGGYRMWQRAKHYLSGARPVYEAMDIEALIQNIDDVFRRVPSHLYGDIVDASLVQSWHLPTVVIRVLDPQIEAQVTAFAPTSANDEAAP